MSRAVRHLTTVAVFAAAVLLGGPRSAAGREPPATRQAFAQALAKVYEGMTEGEVTALLGPPDDVRTFAHPGGVSPTSTRHIWRYGTAGPLTAPTLGHVYFLPNGRVQFHPTGDPGTPPDPALWPEAELRPLLRVLDRAAATTDGHRFDPRAVIRAVNALQQLGKAKALAAVNEYLRVASWLDIPTFALSDRRRDGIAVVLQTLFEVPTDVGYLPWPGVGVPLNAAGSTIVIANDPRLDGPRDTKRLPRFPVWLHDDVPLLLVSELFTPIGRPARPERPLCSAGRLRDTPLTPPDDPLVVMAAWRTMAAAEYETGPTPEVMVMVANQLLALVDTVYRPDRKTGDLRFPVGETVSKRWATHAAAIQKLDIRWDRATQCYTFKDGSRLP